MHLEEVIEVLGLPEDVIDALVAAGQAILSACPELAQAAANELDMYSWYRHSDDHNIPTWAACCMDERDDTVALFDLIQYPADQSLAYLEWRPAPVAMSHTDPMLASFESWRSQYGAYADGTCPAHDVGNQVLLGMMATQAAEYAFHAVVPDATRGEERAVFRVGYRGKNLEHLYVLEIHWDLYKPTAVH